MFFFFFQIGDLPLLLLIEEILHYLTCMKPCKYWGYLLFTSVYHINWSRVRSINSMAMFTGHFYRFKRPPNWHPRLSLRRCCSRKRWPGCICSVQMKQKGPEKGRVWPASRSVTHHWMVATSNIFYFASAGYATWKVKGTYFYFHLYLGRIPILTNIFQMGWNHQLEKVHLSGCLKMIFWSKHHFRKP